MLGLDELIWKNMKPEESKDGNAAAATLNDYDTFTSDLEAKVAQYEKLIQAMEDGELTEELLEVAPSLAKLKQENDRLQYRCGIPEQSIKEELAKTKSEIPGASNEMEQISDYSHGSLLGRLKQLFGSAISKSFPTLENPPVTVNEASKAQFGDYQCNSAMGVSQLLGKSGQKMNPRAVAEMIISNLPESKLVAKVEVAGPGFINVFLNKGEITREVGDLLLDGVKPPKIAKKRAVVDFSSPNIAKEMHVGHLRSTIIGESICRFLEFLGFDVLRLNHVGDWGTQFGMLIAHLQDRFPNYLNETPPIADLQGFYKESKKRFDSEEDFKKRAYECVVKLQNYDENFVKAWKMICDVSRKDYENIYRRLDVSIIERGESFYQKLMGAIVQELDQKGMSRLEEGRKLVWAKSRKFEVPLTVVKSDGGYTYDTSDLAALRQRLLDEKADWVLYVVDSGQGSHLEQIYAVGQDLGWWTPRTHRVEHIAFGLVLGEDKKKFKTRSGETVKLSDLLDEGLTRSLATLKEKEREKVLNEEELRLAQEAVAYGCVKYADLSHNRQQDYVFSFDRMLEDRGNTAVYLLYAYTRIRSIARNANVSRGTLVDFVRSKPLELGLDAEFKLAKYILKFSDCLIAVLENLMMHSLCEYLYDLATVFTEFYNSCYCIEKDKEGTIQKIHLHRLVLCEVTADVMDVGFQILGLKTLHKM